MITQKHVVITRPLLQARPLAQRLTAAGFAAAIFPLLDIEALQEGGQLQNQLREVLTRLSHFALVAFVSPNAVHATMAELARLQLIWPAKVDIAVVGEGSRTALAEHGINDATHRIYCPTDPFRSDSETLLRELDLPALKGREALILRAESGRELLSDALIEHGIGVTKVAAYRRLVPEVAQGNRVAMAQQLGQLIAPPSIWVVSSSEALRTLNALTMNLLGDAGVVQLQQVNLLVSHHRIAETAEKYQFKCVELIGSGDENLLLALQSML